MTAENANLYDPNFYTLEQASQMAHQLNSGLSDEEFVRGMFVARKTEESGPSWRVKGGMYRVFWENNQ